VTALERREAILEVLIERKNEKMINIAYEFSVSKRTIEQDILVLSLSYPIYKSR
jgi:DeoR/GlpR family transcriptional regulator of sugar metabolism